MSSEALYLLSTRIRQMDRGDTTQGLGNPGENIDSYFHPLPGSLSPRQTWQAIEVAGKFASILGNGKAIWRIRVQALTGPSVAALQPRPRPPFARGDDDLILPKLVKSATLAAKPQVVGE